MENLNRTLFLLLNAPAHPAPFTVALAIGCAQYLIWLVPALLVIGWLRGSAPTRLTLLQAALAGLLGLLSSQVFGVAWPHPRPFAIGLGHTLLAHAPDSSFPSDHLTLLWCVSFSLLMHPQLRRVGIALSLMGLPMAWGRIYVGVHYPFDMLGAAGVAIVSAGLLCYRRAQWIEPLFRVADLLHVRLFAPLIRRGWVQK